MLRNISEIARHLRMSRYNVKLRLAGLVPVVISKNNYYSENDVACIDRNRGFIIYESKMNKK